MTGAPTVPTDRDNPIRVLHVDDEPDLAEVATTYLSRANDRLVIETAHSAAEGLEALDENAFDCIVADYEMPRTDGIEFLEAVRVTDPEVPFVLYTGKGSEEVASEAISAGVTDYFRKGTGTEQYKLLANRIVRAVERHRTRRTAEHTRRRFRTLVEEASDAILVVDATATITYATASAERVLGRTPDELLGTSGFEPVHPDDTDRVTAAFDRLGTDVDRTTVEFRYRLPNDTYIWAEARGRDLTDDPDIDGFVIYTRDVTERKERELERERQAAFIENSPDVFFVLDESGTITYQNHASAEILGYEADEYVGEDVTSYVHPEDRETLEADFARLLADPEEPVRSQYRFLLPNGEYRWFENRAINRLDDPAIGGILVINRDISARRRREQRLEALTETSRKLMGAETRTGIAAIGVEAARDVLDLPAVTINLHDEDRGGLVPVEYTDDVRDLVGKPPVFEPGNSIAWRVYERGEVVAIDDVREDPDVYNPDSPITSELLVPISNAGILLAGSTTAEAFDQSDHLLVEILADAIARALDQVARTEQLRARERDLRRQNDRLSEFASVVSHDLRNPLDVAEGRVELAREGRPDDHLPEAANALDRMHALIDDLLALARDGQTQHEEELLDPGEVARDCWRTIETAAAELSVDTERMILADRSRLRQLLENLVRNAIDHGGDDVTVTVGSLEDGFYVADDGPGIPAAERASIFDVGYTSTSDGTGFGLEIVRQVATAHDWTVAVTDSVDGGARFEITGVEFADST